MFDNNNMIITHHCNL